MNARSRGIALLAVLWILLLLTLLAGSALAMVHTSSRSRERTVAAVQKTADVESMLNGTIRLLASPGQARPDSQPATGIADEECNPIDTSDAAQLAALVGRRVSILAADSSVRAVVVLTGDARNPGWILEWGTLKSRRCITASNNS